MSLELALDVVTPVVGGGVASYEPDTVDRVRVQGIRGQFRWFWRALQGAGTVEELFDRERQLWGGSIGDEAAKSRVHIAVQVDEPGRDVPAGYHVAPQRGMFGALPQWEGDRAFGYGLFPLQQSRKDLRAQEGRGLPRVPTRSVREALCFTLRLSLLSGSQGDAQLTATAMPPLQPHRCLKLRLRLRLRLLWPHRHPKLRPWLRRRLKPNRRSAQSQRTPQRHLRTS